MFGDKGERAAIRSRYGKVERKVADKWFEAQSCGNGYDWITIGSTNRMRDKHTAASRCRTRLGVADLTIQLALKLKLTAYGLHWSKPVVRAFFFFLAFLPHCDSTGRFHANSCWCVSAKHV